MPSFPLKRVLVLDACQRSALAVVRSLGKQGVGLVTADETDDALAGCSRYAERYYRHPSARTEPAAFLECLREICRRESIGMILPVTELTSTLLLDAADSFPDIVLPFAPPQTVERLSDKCRLIRFAEQNAIPVPPTRYVDQPGELPDDLDEQTYPLVLKPGKSWIFQEGRWLHTTVRIAQDAAEAKRILSREADFRQAPYMLQSFVPGSGAGIFALYDRGRAVAFFAHRRLREKPPQGGVSVLSESVAPDPGLVAQARKLLDEANWHGVAMVEFRVAADGKACLMEVNTRFWGSLQLAVDAGVDFPWLLYRIACEQAVSPVDHYRTGRRLRWCLGNLDWLYLTLRDPALSRRKKLGAVFRFLRPSPFKTRFEVMRWRDLRPFRWELARYLRDLRRH